MVRMRSIAVLLAAGVLAAAGCGDDSGEDGSPGGRYGPQDAEPSGGDGGGGGNAPGSSLMISADPSGAPKFDETSLTAKPGKVTIVMDNPSDVPHAVAIEGQGIEKAGKTVGKGGVSRVSADLEAGEYEFLCPVGTHADAGMTGTLTVR